MVSKLTSTVHVLNNIANRIAQLVLFVMMFITFIDVVGRYLGRPLPGTFELTELAMSVLFFYSIGHTQVHKGHIRVEILMSRLPAHWRRKIDLVTTAASFMVATLFTWQIAVHAQRLREAGTVSGVLKLPVFLFAAIAAVGSFLYVLALLADWLSILTQEQTTYEP